MIELILNGEPKTKGRPRFTRNGQAYTPKETRIAELEILTKWTEDGSRSLDGDIGMELIFDLGTKRIKDIDNMAKLVLDALNKKAFADDNQIVELISRKRYVGKDKAKTIIRIWEIANGRGCSIESKCESCSRDSVRTRRK